MARIELRTARRSIKTDSKIYCIKIKLISDVKVLFLIYLEVFVEVETSAVSLQKLFDVETWASFKLLNRL